jgi:hypothetical protein
MDQGDGSGGVAVPGWAGIEADLGSLRELAGRIRSEVDATLRPRTEQAFGAFDAGASFGVGSPSVDLLAVRQKYTDCLRAAVDQLVDQLDTSARLVEVISAVTARYGSADALASVSLADLQDAFVAAARVDRAARFGGGANPTGGGL